MTSNGASSNYLMAQMVHPIAIGAICHQSTSIICDIGTIVVIVTHDCIVINSPISTIDRETVIGGVMADFSANSGEVVGSSPSSVSLIPEVSVDDAQLMLR